MVTYRNPAPSKAAFNATTWYRITSVSHATRALDVVNDEHTASLGHVNMAELGNYSGQYWQLRPVPLSADLGLDADSDSTDDVYSLNSMYQGPERRLCIPTTAFPGGGLRPRLSGGTGMAVSPDEVARQAWRIVGVAGEEGMYTVTNMALPLKLGVREGTDYRAVWLVGEEGVRDGNGDGGVSVDVEEEAGGTGLEMRWRIEKVREIHQLEFLKGILERVSSGGEGASMG